MDDRPLSNRFVIFLCLLLLAVSTWWERRDKPGTLSKITDEAIAVRAAVDEQHRFGRMFKLGVENSSRDWVVREVEIHIKAKGGPGQPMMWAKNFTAVLKNGGIFPGEVAAHEMPEVLRTGVDFVIWELVELRGEKLKLP